jgi:hypothetical protein
MNAKNNNYLAIAMIAAGFLLIVLAWNGAAAVDTIQQQFPFLLSGGIGGLGLVVGGITLLLIQEQRRSTAQMIRKLEEILQAIPANVASGDAAGVGSPAHVANGLLTERQRRALERAGSN